MAYVLVEQSFETALTDADLVRLSERLDPCLNMQDASWARSSLSQDRKRMICEFVAPDADAVRAALRSAGIAFDRVYAVQTFRAEDNPTHSARLQAVREKLAARDTDP
jgi:hypothetical protein